MLALHLLNIQICLGGHEPTLAIVLWVLPIGVAVFLGWQVLGGGFGGVSPSSGTTVAPRNAAVARMSYGRFIDYVDAGRVTAVDIFDGGRTAVVEAVDPDLDNRVQRLRVDLPGLAPELVNNLKEQGISFDIHPPRTAPPASACWAICSSRCC